MSMSKQYRIDIRLLEDLHSGTGSTSGELDAVQIRDRHGRPVIRDSHYRGLLREAAFDLVDLGKATESEALAMFGGRGGGRRGGLTSRSLRQSVSGETISWSSSSRRENDRGPRDDLLRIREYVPAGTRFSTEMELLDDNLAGLLQSCVKRTTNLGSRRNRDCGRVVAEFTEVSPPERSITFGEPAAKAPVLRLAFRLLEPACFTTTAVPENLIPTECYLRGQTLQGAFASWALLRGRQAGDLLDPGSGPVFCSGLPLPQGIDTELGISAWEIMPIPLDIRSAKPPPQKRRDCPWWVEHMFADEDTAAAKTEEDETKPKRPGDREFLFRKGATEHWTRYRPEIARHMRNNAGEAGRAGAVAANLFSREEILEETMFLADIRFAHSNQATEFIARFAEIFEGASWIRFGRGGAPAELLRAEFIADVPPVGCNDVTNALRLTLVSDAIIRGPCLGFLDGIDGPTLVDLISEDDNTAKSLYRTLSDVSVEATVDTCLVHGFNASTGLPRQAALCIRRGSVIRLGSKSDAALQLFYNALTKCTALGERIQEGFGVFRIDGPPPVIASPTPTDHDPDPLVSLLNTRLVIAQDLAGGLALSESESPSRSQWFAQLAAVNAAGSHQGLLDMVADLEERADKLGGKAWGNVNIRLLRERIQAASPDNYKETTKLLSYAIVHILRRQNRATLEDRT